MPITHKTSKIRPCGLQWRASSWFITLGTTFLVRMGHTSPFIVAPSGITSDFLIYSIIIPVMPFHLQALGYSEISSLVGYLLVAYSSGLALSTPVIAWYTERLKTRKETLMIGLLALSGSQILLMECREYWIMAIARVLQGISAAAVWTAGLALLCDTVSEKMLPWPSHVWFPIRVSSPDFGFVFALYLIDVQPADWPPVGGALFDRFGIRGPCLFSVIVISVDLVGRLLLIERKEALAWGFDPSASMNTSPDHASHPNSYTDPRYGTFAAETGSQGGRERQASDPSVSVETDSTDSTLDGETGAHGELTSTTQDEPISFFQVIRVLCMSSRAVAAVLNSLVSGILYSFQEPALPLHLQKTWQLNSSQVGLVFIPAALFAMLAPPIAGLFTDHIGTEWVSFLCLILAVPWWIAVTTCAKLPFFVAAFAFENLFTAAFVAPVTTELALVSRCIRGVGYAHVYGAFNFAVGIGAAVGPALSGEIFQRYSQGWTILNLVAVAIIVAASAVVALFTGERPLARRLRMSRAIKLPREP
ncbi:major facilitator superfamily domain-containing protein [Russula brevipes]|nr:major facilitator superfamily domain-containing protein [Russula brevipes]